MQTQERSFKREKASVLVNLTEVISFPVKIAILQVPSKFSSFLFCFCAAVETQHNWVRNLQKGKRHVS